MIKMSKNDREKSTRTAPQSEDPFERPSPPSPWISFQTRLYSCPFCKGFVVDHPLELSRHMLTEHEIYFKDYVADIEVNRVSDRLFDEGELEAFRRILRDWIDEGFTMPPYDPPIQRVIDKLGLEG